MSELRKQSPAGVRRRKERAELRKTLSELYERYVQIIEQDDEATTNAAMIRLRIFKMNTITLEPGVK